MEGPAFFQTILGYLLPLLPLVAFAELFVLLWGRSHRHKKNDADWREAFLRAATIWALATFAFTELLSLRSELTLLYLAICWGLADLVLLILLVWAWNPAERVLARIWSTAMKLPLGQKALLFWITLSLAITAVIALVTPPNNGDSMAYHMSRVAHWWANRTVVFYPTNIQRQVYPSPLAEYMILQFFVLGGGSDHFANMMQWFSFGGCAVAMSVIARRLGANTLTQFLVAFVVLTTPISIAEAMTTQNDLACAFLTATALYFLYAGRTIWTGLCLGLAILVKSTAGLMIAPFLVLYLIRQPLSKHGVPKAAIRIFGIGCIVICLNAPHWLRNQQTFHNPLGYKAHLRWIESQTIAPGPMVTNIMRDLSLELITRSRHVSKLEEDAIRRICRLLRLDPDDPRNTFPPARIFTVGTMTFNEDYAANPLQIALLIVATIFLLASRRFRTSEFAKFAILVWCGFLLFALRLAWQPSLSRILTPFVVVASLPIAFFLSEVRGRYRVVTRALLAILAAMSSVQLGYCAHRLAVSARSSSSFEKAREEMYFERRPFERSCYLKTIDQIAAGTCHLVGLKLPENEYEYPLWAIARLRGQPIIFEHVDVENETRSAKSGLKDPPCAILTINGDSGESSQTKPASLDLRTADSNGTSTSTFDCEKQP